MTKELIIGEINEIISDYGSFSVGEVEADCSPCVNTMGSFVALAEEFREDEATIEIYNPSSFSSDSMSDYIMAYNDMEVKTLQEILELAKRYKDNQI